MRRIAFVITTISAFAVSATISKAGGVPTQPPPPAVVVPATDPDWGGFYGGIQLEYGSGDIDYAGVAGANFPSSDVDGALYGIFAGYRVDYGSVVFGTEFDYMFGSLDADVGGISSIDAIMRATLELGVDAGPAFVYGTAGVHGTFVTTSLGIDDDDWGPVYGVGVDYRLTERTSIGAELLQHEISDFSGGGADISVTTFGVNVAFQF